MTASAHWHLTYADDLVSEPLLWELAQRFGLHTNIRRANVDENKGWVIVEVRGSPSSREEGRAWLEARGVRVADLPAPGGPDPAATGRARRQ